MHSTLWSFARPVTPLLIAFLLPSAGGCSASTKAERSAADPARAVPPLPEGVVSLPEASRSFVHVEAVRAQSGVALLKAPARVTFRDGAVSKLGAPLPGRVEQVHVRSGARVRAGDPLVTLDCPEAAANRAAVAGARAAERQARAALERHARMVDRGVGTERERLEAERALAEAEAELSRALASERFVGKGAGNKVVLHAPIDGVVVSRSATVGAAVEPGGEPLVEVGDTDSLWVVADVFERDVPHVREGMQVEVELPSLHTPAMGRVESVGSVLEEGARTAPVRIVLERQDAQLWPGMFGRARIVSPDEVLSVPASAVLMREKESVVFVQSAEDRFTRRPVHVGSPVDGRLLVSEGLQPGDRIVVRGALLLDGAADMLL